MIIVGTVSLVKVYIDRKVFSDFTLVRLKLFVLFFLLFYLFGLIGRLSFEIDTEDSALEILSP